MQPIPYEPVPGDAPGAMALKFSICGLIFIVGLILLILGVRGEEDKRSKFQSFAEPFGGLLIIVGFFAAFIVYGIPGLRFQPTYAQSKAHISAVQDEVEKTYDLKLKDYQAEELNYPAEAPRKTDFLLYGSFDESKPVEGKEFAFDSRTVYLVWSKGKLGLSESADGESFTPITPKQEAK